MNDYFDELINQLREHHLSINQPFIHGLLTGFATTPDPDLAKLYHEIAGEHLLPEKLQEELVDVLDFLSEDLSVNEFHALFQTDSNDKPEIWINGYLKAVEIHEEQWHKENECHPKAGAAFVILHSLVNDELRKELKIAQPGHQELREQPKIVTDLAHTIYQHFHGDLDDTSNLDERFDPPADELPPLPDYSEEALAGMDENLLFTLITNNDDRLPLEVVRMCAIRADAMVPLLHQHLENDNN